MAAKQQLLRIRKLEEQIEVLTVDRDQWRGACAETNRIYHEHMEDCHGVSARLMPGVH